MIMVNFLSGALFFFFYYPPNFYEKFQNRTKMQQIKEFDYVGTFLFIGGFIIFLLGLSWVSSDAEIVNEPTLMQLREARSTHGHLHALSLSWLSEVARSLHSPCGSASRRSRNHYCLSICSSISHGLLLA